MSYHKLEKTSLKKEKLLDEIRKCSFFYFLESVDNMVDSFLARNSDFSLQKVNSNRYEQNAYMVIFKVSFELIGLFETSCPVDVLDDETLFTRVHNFSACVDQFTSIEDFQFTFKSFDFYFLVFDLLKDQIRLFSNGSDKMLGQFKTVIWFYM